MGAVVGHDNVSAVRLRDWLCDVGDYVVPGSEGLLLCKHGKRLCDHSFARDHTDSPAHSVPNTAAYATAHTATYCATHSATHSATLPTQPPAPADPYNCADGFANWQAGWSVVKKEWCCRMRGKGCPNQGGGCVTSSEPYDCNAGFANWMAGWSVAKKAWCCANKGRGCPPAAGGCA